MFMFKTTTTRTHCIGFVDVIHLHKIGRLVPSKGWMPFFLKKMCMLCVGVFMVETLIHKTLVLTVLNQFSLAFLPTRHCERPVKIRRSQASSREPPL
jgi:di/tricarboxylate transporter